MKKLFTSLLLSGLCLGASAQILNVTVDGKPVANGDVVTSSTLDLTEVDGVVFMWELKPETVITVNEGARLIVSVTNPEGLSKVTYPGGEEQTANVSFCGVTVSGGRPGNCVPVSPGQTVTQTQTLKVGESGELECYFMSTANDPDTYAALAPLNLSAVAQVKIEAEGDESEESFEFTLNLVYPAAGVKEIGSEDALFSVAGGRVVADGEVEVYDLAGRRVANEGLDGMYIVRSAGRTAKVVVK